MGRPAIKGVFFDADGVLYTRERSTSAAARDILQRNGYSTTLTIAVSDELNALELRAKCGLLSSDAYWDEFLARHGVATTGERDALRRQIMTHAENVVPLPDVRETLATLKKRGLTLGVITDTIYPLAVKLDWLGRIDVAGLIDVIACSTAVGVHKPDPAIYQDALTRAGLTAAESAFVGHDAHELAGAKHVGMLTIAVHGGADVRADYNCGGLLELLTLPVFAAEAKAHRVN